MLEFVQQYFVEPITKFGGYNIVNTVVYLSILVIAAILIFRLFHKRVQFDLRFGLAVLPFIVLGGAVRALENIRLLPRSANPLELGFYTITPGIYLAVGLFVIIALLFSLWLGQKIGRDYVWIFGLIGTAVALPVLIFDLLLFQSWFGAAEAVLLAVVLSSVAWLALKKWKPSFGKDMLSLLAIAGQALDGSTTFVATQFNSCTEEFMGSHMLVSFAPWLFPVLKVVLMTAVVYLLDEEVKNENLRGYVKVVLIILGFAPALHDWFALALGACS
ncbi:MAG: DUF63 family protein [Candidatus Diapherotrites archaeon]